MTNMSKGRQKAARRQERRRQAQQRQMIRNMIVITGFALIIAAIAIWRANQPIGEIVEVTPKERPIFSGKTLGSPEAPVTIEVFEDFQCPACKVFTDEIEPQVIDNYVTKGQAQIIFHHYAFIGTESRQAANASMCAAEQERFWDYHDIVFANQTGENIGAFTNRRLEAFAETIGLEMTTFNACFDQNKYKNEINSDFALGQSYGIQGTPSIVIDGQLLPDFQFFSISQAIQQALGQ